MTFELTTLRLTTTFDPPQGAVGLGEPLRNGRHPAVVLVEGGHPPHGGVLRANRSAPLVGLRVPEAAGAGALRVTVVLEVDSQSWRRWADHHADTDLATRGAPHLHRLLTITAQGAPRAACLLVPDESGATRQRVQLRLGPEEIGRDGLLVLGLVDTQVPAGWAEPLPGGAIGAVISRVVIEPVDEKFRPSVSTGRPPPEGARPETSVPPGYLVATPGPPGSTLELRLHTKRPRPARVEAVTTTGRRLLDETVAPAADGAIDVRLGPLEGPVLIRAVDLRKGEVRAAYQVDVHTRPASEGES